MMGFRIIARYPWLGGDEMRKEKGFSLIELLIVVAIILIIAAIAIPNLLRARIAANESSGVSSIRTINTGEITYQSTYPAVGYAGTLASMGPATAAGCGAAAPTSTNACLIDFVLSNASTAATAKSGYFFLATPAASGGRNVGYTAGGAPASANQTGVRGFCSNEDGAIRYTPTAATPVTTSAGCAAYTALQ
jgi:type IV pilus assembly protein PilA